MTVPITRADMFDVEELPCGCITGKAFMPTGERTFVMIPHDLDCRYYRYAIEYSTGQGKPVYFGDDR